MRNEKLYRRGGIYYARVQTSRGIKRVSTKCTDKRAAEAVLRRLEQEANGAAGAASDAPPHSLAEALDHLINDASHDASDGTKRMWFQKANQLVRILGMDLDVNAMRVDLVQGYIAERLKEGAARETVRKELSTLRRALTVARDRGALLLDPGALIPSFKVRYEPKTRYLTPIEFWTLVRALRPHRQLWAIVAVYTGARYSEVCGLCWEHIDWRARTILLPGTKTRKSRRLVPLHPALAYFLEPLSRSHGLIVGEWGSVRHDLNRITERLGLAHTTPNDLRRTFASWLVQDGVSSRLVAELLGHSSTRMVDLVYGQIDQATLARAMGRLPAPEWTCAAGVLDQKQLGGKRGEDGERPAPNLVDNRAESVPGAGIEPATRGFSVRALPAPRSRFCLVKGGRK